MSRAQQPSILSFFQPNNKQQPPKYAAPPTSQAQQQQQQQPLQQFPSAVPPPPPPPPQPVAPVIPALPVTALPPTTPSPHPSATIVPVTDAHIPALRRINALLLPVNYTDSFYKAILDPAQSGLFSRAILFRDGDGDPAVPSPAAPKVVGGIVCRLEPSPFDQSTGAYSPDLARRAHARVSPPDSRVLYVQSLGVLAPYRGLGLAAAAVEGVFDAVRSVAADARGNGLNIGWVYAHVWTENHDALEWYARRGFERDIRLENYYFKLQPGSAWVMKRRVLPLGVGEQAAGAGVVLDWTATNGQAAHQPSAVPASVTAAAVNLPGFSPAGSMPTPPPSASNGPPPAARPGPPGSSLSFQNKRPDMEWNDLPEDMVAAARTTSRTKDLLSPPTGSGSSSRSSSTTGRKKKDRAYPTAAFGS